MKRAALAFVALVCAGLLFLFVRNRVVQDRAAAAAAADAWAALLANDDFVMMENPEVDGGEVFDGSLE